MMQRYGSYAYLALGLVAIVLLNMLTAGLSSYEQRIVVNIGINMILAVSLNLVNGFTGQFSLGHAGFMSIGAYASAAFTTMLFMPAGDGSVSDGMLFISSLLAGGIAAALAGLLVGVPSLRLKGDYLAIVTLGFGEIIRVVLQNVKPLGGALGMSDIPRVSTFLWVYVILAIVVFVIQQIIRTTYGKGFLAVRDDEIAAEAMGVNTTRYKVVAFVVGAFFAGVAGGLYAHYNSLIKPDDFGFLKSVEIVVMVILGGMGSTYGVILAAAVLTYLPEWLRDFELFGIRFSEFRMSIYSLVLIVLMLVRPQGLFGGVKLKRPQAKAKGKMANAKT